MRKIYLATDSKARRRLFKIFGLKFKIMPSQVKERKRLSNLSYPQLVKINALSKAEEVAKKVQDGIIIAADTIVVCENKILGKPKDGKDAKKMLMLLSGKKHLIITAFTIINASLKQIIRSAMAMIRVIHTGFKPIAS